MAEIVVRLIIEPRHRDIFEALFSGDRVGATSASAARKMNAAIERSLDAAEASARKQRNPRVRYMPSGRRRPRPLVQPTLDALLASPNQTMKLRTLARKLRRPVSDFYRIRHQRSDLFETPKRGYIKASVPS